MGEENKPSEKQINYANSLKKDLGEEGNKKALEILKTMNKEQISDFSELTREEISKVIEGLKSALGYENKEYKSNEKSEYKKSTFGKDIIPLGELEKRLHQKYKGKKLKFESFMEYVDRANNFYICKVRLTTPDGSFEAIGDADKQNTQVWDKVNNKWKDTEVSKALPRMSESRARSRCIKLALGLDCISKEELGGEK